MDKVQNNRKIIMVCLVAVMITFAVVVGCLVFILPSGSNGSRAATADEMTVPTETTAVVTTSPVATQPQETTAAVTGPEELTQILAIRGNTYEELESYGCKQLVTVTADGTSASIKLFESADGVWSENTSLSTTGFVGAEGAIENMSEQRSGTPVGIYSIGEAFYIGQAPATSLNSFEVTQDTYWVDDPDSAFYNQRVEGTASQDWNSAEHMIDYGSSYEYGFVINYNTPDVVPGAGSAIFFHIGIVPTQGCVATTRDMVLGYLAELDCNLNPYIIIN